jgi:hypothetical protein
MKNNRPEPTKAGGYTYESKIPDWVLIASIAALSIALLILVFVFGVYP